jgi:hypothetical protein
MAAIAFRAFEGAYFERLTIAVLKTRQISVSVRDRCLGKDLWDMVKMFR